MEKEEIDDIFSKQKNPSQSQSLNSRILVDLKCGYDMPILDECRLPSMYFETSYSILPGFEATKNQQASTTIPLNRNPKWNEQISVPILPQNLQYEYVPGESSEETERRVKETMIMVNGKLQGYIQFTLYDENLSYTG